VPGLSGCAKLTVALVATEVNLIMDCGSKGCQQKAYVGDLEVVGANSDFTSYPETMHPAP